MDESEKRKERLKAMRLEASRAESNNVSESFELPSHGLSNPLVESDPTLSAPVQRSSRFDFYTDPMSAYSTNRRNNFNPQVPQGYHGMSPGPNYPGMALTPANQCSSIQTSYNQSPSPGSLVGATSPLSNTANAWSGSVDNDNCSSSLNFPKYNFIHSGSGRGNFPHVIHQGRGALHGRNVHSHHYDSGSNHYDSGSRSSNFLDLGRGRGRLPGKHFGPSSVTYGRRGTVSRDSISAEQRPDLYYRKEMLEDPWKLLSPIVWKGLKSGKSWLPKSISVKKAKAASVSQHKSISQPSLAEYLAASFNEAADESTS